MPPAPRLQTQRDAEVELPPRDAAADITAAIAIPASREEPDALACALVQGAHHRERADQHGWSCSVTIRAADGFAPGPATLSVRVWLHGAWSSPGSARVQLVVPGTLTTETTADGTVIVTSRTRTAALVGNQLSFPLWTQNPNGDVTEPAYPFLGRIVLRVPASGIIDQVIPLDARWLAALAASAAWKDSAGPAGEKLLVVKAVHVTGSYSIERGARLLVSVAGDTDLDATATATFRPAGYQPGHERDPLDLRF
ncbi:MAG TPA: hypothetical protein VH165_10420 [Kofleriaceae bacterium]|nr:hypothetical protein [Kofleriaceae bacterium]